MLKDYNAEQMENSWKFDKRWLGIERPYTSEDVCRLRGTVQIEYTLARMGAERLWQRTSQCGRQRHYIRCAHRPTERDGVERSVRTRAGCVGCGRRRDAVRDIPKHSG